MTTSTTRGLLLVGSAAVIWSTGGVVLRLVETTDSWTIIFWRSVWATLAITGFVIARDRRETRRSFRSVGGPGLIVAGGFATASIALVIAIEKTSVANSLVILSTAPLLAAALARLVLGESVRRRTWFLMFLALLGVAVMVGGPGPSSSLTGDALAVLMPVGLAVATVTIRKYQHILMTPAMAVGTLIALVVAATQAGSLRVTAGDFVLLAAFGAIQLGLGLALYALGARVAPPAEVAMVALLEPVLGPIWPWLVVGERPGIATLIGGSIVLAAMVAHSALDLRRRAMPPAA
ncbi:MAG: DMT family transporter [Acidimicrobiia bacterium]|nr:DMT family transporter [Acidimicrobiia bacterium]